MTVSISAKEQIIVALDTDDPTTALGLVNNLSQLVSMFKVGPELLLAPYIEHLTTDDVEICLQSILDLRGLYQAIGHNLFVDLKFHDTPSTVAGALRGIVRLLPKFFTVHVSGGQKTLDLAVKLKPATCGLLDVSVLTSISREECLHIFGKSPEEMVREFADMLLLARAEGIVCSARDLPALADRRYAGLLKVIPGIRPDWYVNELDEERKLPWGQFVTDDHERYMTPRDALAAGADYLVIGRPITASRTYTPVEAVKKIIAEIS